MSRNKMISLIGLAMKAGKIVSGEFMTEKSVKTGKAELVLVAADASDNTRKKFQNMCAFYEVPVFFAESKDALGREYRASMAVQDANFASAIRKELERQKTDQDSRGME